MENKIGLRLGFIGVGQCGGNIANEFAKLGYKTVAINTSLTDLGKLESIPKNNRLLISSGIQGAGKNPELGQQAFEEHAAEVMHLLEQVFDQNIDLIYVCAGLGGGTGSGVAPLLTQILLEEGRKVGMIVTLPSDIEAPKVKIVALDAFEKISQIEDLGSIFIIDNAKEAKALPNQMGYKMKYTVVNQNIALKLDTVNRLTTVASDTAFDARDLLTLLTARGAAIVATSPIGDVSELKETETLAQIARKAIDSAIFADSEPRAKGCALLFELPQGGDIYLTEDALAKMQAELGTPFEVFHGIYESRNLKRDGTIHLVITGLPFPNARLERLQSELMDRADDIQAMFEATRTQAFTGNGKALFGRFIASASAPAPKPAGESTLDKILKKKKS